MKLRLVQFNLGSGNRAGAEAMANEMVPAIRNQPGFQSCVFFGDDESGDYGLAVVWDSQENADAAAAVVSPMMMKGVQNANGSMGFRRLFDVIEA